MKANISVFKTGSSTRERFSVEVLDTFEYKGHKLFIHQYQKNLVISEYSSGSSVYSEPIKTLSPTTIEGFKNRGKNSLKNKPLVEKTKEYISMYGKVNSDGSSIKSIIHML